LIRIEAAVQWIATSILSDQTNLRFEIAFTTDNREKLKYPADSIVKLGIEF